MPDDRNKPPPQGRLQRLRKLAGLTASVGTDVLSRGVRRLAGRESEVFGAATAEKLVATLGDMKGMAMKLGQLLSMDVDVLTPELRAIVGKLQNQAPSMPYERVVEVIEQSLGEPPARAFAHFEPTPMAAASIGQVHRARMHDGREVVVKVQYPGIDVALQSDLDNMGTLVKTMALTGKTLDGSAYYQEMREQFLLELDYEREAALCEEMRAVVAAFPELVVPQAILTHTTKTVLTLEYLKGPTLREFVAALPDNAERLRVSRLLVRAIYAPLLSAGLVHADPHPGNFLVLEDGRLALLDFGAVKTFSPRFLTAVRAMLRDTLAGRPVDALTLCKEVGFTVELPEEEARARVKEILHLSGRPLRSTDYDYAEDKTTKELKLFGAQNVNKFLKVRPPAEAMLFFRAAGGLAQNLRLLAARGDFSAIYRELGPTIADETAQTAAQNRSAG